MSENTALWDKLGKTDPGATKGFTRAGGFKGTAIKPMWSYKRMTEEFGPCGIGWGVNMPTFQLVTAGDEMLVYCTATVWYGNRDQVTVGVGGDKVAGKNKFGPVTDDEAFKKAFTDAVTNALKMIGVGADVHMGMFDDNKYVNTMKQEFADDASKAEEPKKASAAEQKRALAEIDSELLDCHSVIAVNKCADGWKHIAKRDSWSRDYINEASKKFQERRDALVEQEGFPGDTDIRDQSGRRLHSMEAA